MPQDDEQTAFLRAVNSAFNEWGMWCAGRDWERSRERCEFCGLAANERVRSTDVCTACRMKAEYIVGTNEGSEPPMSDAG